MNEMNEKDLEQVVGGAVEVDRDFSLEWYKKNCKQCAKWKVSCTAKQVDARLMRAKSEAAQGTEFVCPDKK